MATVLVASGFETGISLAAGTTRYFSILQAINSQTVESRMQFTVGSAGLFANAYLRVITNATTTSSTYRFRVNAGNGTQTLSIGAGATGEFEDPTNTDAVIATDEVNHQISVGATGAIVIAAISLTFAATNDTVTFLGSSRPIDSSSTASAVRYFGVASGAVQTTESLAYLNVQAPGVLKNFFLNVEANGRTTTTTFGSRVNAANGALAISVGAGATGLFQDTSNQDSLAAGDLVNGIHTNGTGAGVVTFRYAMNFVTTNNRGLLTFGEPGGFAVAAPATIYKILGGLSLQETTEANAAIDANVAQSLSQLWVNISANAATTTATTIRLRINAANGTQVLSIAAGATGEFLDSTNTDALIATDEMDIQIANGDAAGAVTCRCGSLLVTIGSDGWALTSPAVFPSPRPEVVAYGSR